MIAKSAAGNLKKIHPLRPHRDESVGGETIQTARASTVLTDCSTYTLS